MKKTTITIILFVTLIVSGVRPANAIFGVGDITFDPAALVQNLINYAKQGLQYVQEKMTAAATQTGAAQQTIDTVNNTYLIPARDALTIIAMVKSGKIVQNMVLDETGVDPLLVRNPEAWIQGKKNEIVRSVVDNPEVQKAIYDESVMRALIGKSKVESSDLYARLVAINGSNMQKIEQDARCNDISLTKQAMKDMEGSGTTYDANDIARRKRDIENAICGDLQNPQTREALAIVVQRTPSTGWDGWLSMTSGDNEYTRRQRSLEEVENQKAIEEAKRKAELAAGGGIKNKEVCVRYNVPDDKNSGCAKWEIAQTGDIMNSSFKDALSNPLKIQLAGFGKGAGNLVSSLANVIGSAYTTVDLLQSIGKDLGVTGNSGGSSNPSASNNGVTTTKSFEKDLVNNPEGKKNISSSPLEQLQKSKSSLTGLITTETKYLAAIDIDKNNLDDVKNCFAYIVNTYEATFPEVVDDKRVIAGQDFYSDSLQKNRELHALITKEKQGASLGVSLIDSIISQINASQSSEEILDLFLGYQNKLKEKNIPEEVAAVVRDGEYTNFKQITEDSTKGQEINGNVVGGDIYLQIRECDSLRKEMETKTQNGQNNQNQPNNNGGGV